jgi:hypothetical protein
MTVSNSRHPWNFKRYGGSMGFHTPAMGGVSLPPDHTYPWSVLLSSWPTNILCCQLPPVPTTLVNFTQASQLASCPVAKQFLPTTTASSLPFFFMLPAQQR